LPAGAPCLYYSPVLKISVVKTVPFSTYVMHGITATQTATAPFS
jgi:hypothetical protein